MRFALLKNSGASSATFPENTVFIEAEFPTRSSVKVSPEKKLPGLATKTSNDMFEPKGCTVDTTEGYAVNQCSFESPQIVKVCTNSWP